jgi:hypothetical protein
MAVSRTIPQDRTNALESFDAADLISPIESGYSTPERLDPYWDQLWTSGSSVNWTSYATAERHIAAGLGSLPKVMLMSEEEAWAKLLSPYTRNQFLRFLSTLGAWRTMSGEQVEAMSGCFGSSNVLSRLMAAAFRVGLIDFGSSSIGLKRTGGSNRGVLYRPTNGKAIEKVFAHLTTSEWTSFTGGQSWERGGQFDRHNVLSTELGLRLAEYTDIATVLGEKFSTADLLAGSGIGWEQIKGDTKSADLVVVRPDGLKIAVEVTASLGAQFTRKVERWAELLNDRPQALSGLSVVFVVAPPQGGGGASTVRSDTYKAVASVVRQFPGTAQESIASRIGVATWTEWFPEKHKISPRFLNMTVDMAAGMKDGEMTWTETELLDMTAYPFAPKEPGLVAILDNMHLLWSAPTWLRDHRRAPSLVPTMLAAAGRAGRPIPYSQPKRPKTSKGHEPGRGKGVVGDTKPPRRLLPYM